MTTNIPFITERDFVDEIFEEVKNVAKENQSKPYTKAFNFKKAHQLWIVEHNLLYQQLNPGMSDSHAPYPLMSDYLNFAEKFKRIGIIKRIGSTAGDLIDIDNFIVELVPQDFIDYYSRRYLGQPMPNAVSGTSMISLADASVGFDNALASIFINKIKCSLPAFLNEHLFCRVMFAHRVGESVDWSVVHNEMTGKTDGVGGESDMRALRDTMYHVNTRIKEMAHTGDDLFSWKNKAIKRNF